MDATTLQAELDQRFGTTERDRALMRSGQMPETLRRRLSKGWGCLRVMVGGLGALAGAFFGWNVRPVVAAEQPLWLVAGVGALLGAVIAVALFSRRFRGMSAFAQGVKAEVHELRLEKVVQGDRTRTTLVTDSGLRIGAFVLKAYALPPGRYRVFYVDVSTPGEEAARDEKSLQAVGLEPA